MRNDTIDLTGQKYGRITVLEQVKKPDNIKYTRATYWLCRCDCGTEKIINGYKLRRGFIESCGCLKRGKGCEAGQRTSAVMKNKSKPKFTGHTYGVSHIYRYYKASAKTKKLEFSLTVDQFFGLITANCFYCGNSIFDGKEIKFNGIDRTDSSKGYVKSNVVPCCKQCNIAKHTYSRGEFYKWIEKVYNYSIVNKRHTA
jgi:hypothetical protein